jgi:hypothetical protein
MRLALVTSRASQTARNGEQRRLHVEVVLDSEGARFGRNAVPTDHAAQPKAIA